MLTGTRDVERCWQVHEMLKDVDRYTRCWFVCCLLFKNELIWRNLHFMTTKDWTFKAHARHLWAGRDVYRATPAVARGLGFYSLIRKTVPDTRLFTTSMEYRELILTRIPTGLIMKSTNSWLKTIPWQKLKCIMKYLSTEY